MLDLVLQAFRRSRDPQTAARISKQRISGNVYLKSSRWPDYFPTDARARQRWVLMESGRWLDPHPGQTVGERKGAGLLRQGYERTGVGSKLTDPNTIAHNQLTTEISGENDSQSQQ